MKSVMKHLLADEKRKSKDQAALIEQMGKALELAEDVLSRRPFSTEIWPNGTHPQTGIELIRAALAASRKVS